MRCLLPRNRRSVKCLPLPLGRLPRPSKSMAAARINPMLIRIARPDIEKDPATG
jgi:hypothetical protein